MKEKLQAIRQKAIEKIEAAESLDILNDLRVAYLGKKGEMTEVLKGMKDVAAADRPAVGQLVNDARKAIEEKIEAVKKTLEAKELERKLKDEVIDVTLPSKKLVIGHKHPNKVVLDEVERIFTG
ncbi:MAG: phenylalanine--tRNA ligase subunit alpha, partial [Parasporobacterium sp.]|nr:phenylalanine--tRNA ligase subunit alpha [Parasporobacterium sp.]